MSIQTLKIPIQTGSAKPYIKQGDTIDAITFTFGVTDAIDLTLANVVIKMQVYNQGNKIIDVSNGSGITIVGAKVFNIDEVAKENNNLPFGKFLGDLEITDTNGKRFTYFNIEYTIIEQFTKP